MCWSISWSTCRTFFSIRAYVIEMSATTFIVPSTAAPKSVSPTWRRFRDAFRRHPTALIGGVILIVMVAIAFLAPWLGTIDPQAVSPLSTLLGLAIGLVTGYVRRLDAIVMRVMDGLMSIPSVLLAIALMALTKASIGNVIVAITLAEVPRVVRLVRSLVLTLREQPYVEAAVAAGTSLPRILVRHILPNTTAPLLVQGTYVCGSAMITEAILSFIGAGTPPNIPSWGNIMAEGRSLIQIAGYLVLFPGICLSLTVLAVNLLGDGMRDALDPRLARRM